MYIKHAIRVFTSPSALRKGPMKILIPKQNKFLKRAFEPTLQLVIFCPLWNEPDAFCWRNTWQKHIAMHEGMRGGL